MAEDLMRYDLLAQDALRGVVRLALKRVERDGLPGEHHFFIAFSTHHSGVRMSQRLRRRYEEEMTIVLQHQFWNLHVHDSHFEVELSFNEIPERLSVPFAAVKGFFDPSVQFGLQFETSALSAKPSETESAATPAAAEKPEEKAAEPTEATEAAPAVADEAAGEEVRNVVSLDAFRKK